MQKIGLILLALGFTAIQPVSAQNVQPNAMILAQAHDRCMTTFAVRESKTDSSDDEIYSIASSGCKELQTKMFAAIRAEYPAAQATPNFIALIERIRNDRQRRAGN